MRCKERPVGLSPCPYPGRLGQRCNPRGLRDQLRGQPRRPLVVAPGAPDERSVLRTGVRLSRSLEKPLRLVVSDHLVREPAQGSHLLGPARDASSRHVRLMVPEEEALRRIQVVYRRQPVLELLVSGLLLFVHKSILASRGQGLARRNRPVLGSFLQAVARSYLSGMIVREQAIIIAPGPSRVRWKVGAPTVSYNVLLLFRTK